MDSINPDARYDQLPQPFRFLDKLARGIVDAALDMVSRKSSLSTAISMVSSSDQPETDAHSLASAASSLRMQPNSTVTVSPTQDFSITALDVCVVNSCLGIVITGNSQGCLSLSPLCSPMQSALDWFPVHPDSSPIVAIASRIIEGNEIIAFVSVSKLAIRLHTLEISAITSGNLATKLKAVWSADLNLSQEIPVSVKLSNDCQSMVVSLNGCNVLLFKINTSFLTEKQPQTSSQIGTQIGEIHPPQLVGIDFILPKFVSLSGSKVPVVARPASGQPKRPQPPEKKTTPVKTPDVHAPPTSPATTTQSTRTAKTPSTKPSEKQLAQQQPPNAPTPPQQDQGQNGQQLQRFEIVKQEQAAEVLFCNKISSILIIWQGFQLAYKHDLRNGNGQTIELPGQPTCLTSTSSDSNGDIIASIGLSSGGILLLKTLHCIGSYIPGRQRDGAVNSIAFCGQKFLISTNQNGPTILIREIPTGKPIKIIQCSAGGPISLFTSPLNRAIVVTKGSNRQQTFALNSRGELDSTFSLAGAGSSEISIENVFLPTAGSTANKCLAFVSKKHSSFIIELIGLIPK